MTVSWKNPDRNPAVIPSAIDASHRVADLDEPEGGDAAVERAPAQAEQRRVVPAHPAPRAEIARRRRGRRAGWAAGRKTRLAPRKTTARQATTTVLTMDNPFGGDSGRASGQGGAGRARGESMNVKREAGVRAGLQGRVPGPLTRKQIRSGLDRVSAFLRGFPPCTRGAARRFPFRGAASIDELFKPLIDPRRKTRLRRSAKSSGVHSRGRSRTNR